MDNPIDLENGDTIAIGLNLSNGTTLARYQKIDNCSFINSNSVQFLDDGIGGNYYEGINRSDTIELCASQGGVIIVFTQFSLALGDTLFAYQGDIKSLHSDNQPILKYGAGKGVSNAFGGWLDADCRNTSGCLTFIFETNGDSIGDSGWESWWNCKENKGEILDCPDNREVNSSLLPEVTGVPILYGCSIDTMYYIDNPLQPVCDFDPVLNRDWFIIDNYGDTHTCSQELIVHKNISDIILPTDILSRYCSDSYLDIDSSDLDDLTVTGIPTIYDIPLSTERFILGYFLVVSDDTSSVSEIKRNFTIFDWCRPELGAINIGHQIISRNLSENTNRVNCQILITNNEFAKIGNGGIEGSLKRYVKTRDCGGYVTNSSVRFTDDGGIDNLYGDSDTRNDTIELCAQSGDVKIVFTEFDLASGDTLFVYQGNRYSLDKDFNPAFEFGTGTNVSNAFGGWVDAHSDSIINPSGCLTFIFKTNGDNIKGCGWESWWDCALDDQDNDGVPDINDICANGDDNINTDGVGMPDACDCNPNDANDEYIEVNGESPNGDIISGIYHASFELKSNSKFIANDTLLFLAGRNIILQPGFEVRKGSEFLAKIDLDCSEPIQNVRVNLFAKKINNKPLNKVEAEVIRTKVFPNPFNQSAIIEYYLSRDSYVNITVYDSWGKEIKVLQSSDTKQGHHFINCSLDEVSRGTYFMVLQTNKDVITEKLLLLD